MTRYTLTLPLADNDGADLADLHAALQRDLVAVAGGFTCTASLGGWQGDDGTVYVEAGRVYTVDSDDDLWPALHTLAVALAGDARQEAVYLTRQPVTAVAVVPVGVVA